MIKHIQRIAVLSVLVLVALPSLSLAAPSPTKASVTTPDHAQTISSIQSRVNSLRSIVDYIQRLVQRTGQERLANQEKVQAGLAPETDLALTEDKLAEAMNKLEQAMSELADAERLAALTTPIDVDFKSAGIRQVAETLSKAADVRITVNESVPKDLYVTLEAKHSPLGAVLEMTAISAELVIAPGERGSILLIPPSQIRINGERVDMISTTLPWSYEWPSNPGGLLGQRWIGLLREVMPTPASSAPLWATGDMCQPLITSVSPNAFIVGEPGKSEQGEPGMWLTYYSIDSGRMIPGIRYFHRFTTDPPKSEEKPAK